MKAVSSANSLTPPRPNCALCSLLHFTATYLGCTNHSISWYTVLIRFCLLSLCGKLVWPLLSSFVLFFIQMVVTRKGIIHWNLGYCKQSDMGTMYWTVMSIHHCLKSGLEIVLARYRTESVRVAGQLKVILVQWWERAAQGMKTETAKETQGGGRRRVISLVVPSLWSSGYIWPDSAGVT